MVKATLYWMIESVIESSYVKCREIEDEPPLILGPLPHLVYQMTNKYFYNTKN